MNLNICLGSAKLLIMINKYQIKRGKTFECGICPYHCILSPGDIGKCLIRECSKEGIHLEGYGRVSSMVVDPIEKKPIFHYKPNSKVLSIGAWGCSLNCSWCENTSISKKKPNNCKYFSASAISHMAQVRRCQGVCFTYNEPSISYEFLMDVSEKCHDAGLFFAIKTNGFVEKEPWKEICDACDAMNIDWKIRYDGFSEAIDYSRIVIKNIESAIENKKLHVELSIPIYNDMTTAEQDGIARFLGIGYPNIPVHLLKISPIGQYSNPPVDDETILSFRNKLMEKSQFIYVENIFTEEGKCARNTICPECKNIVAVRESFVTTVSLKCGTCKSILK